MVNRVVPSSVFKVKLSTVSMIQQLITQLIALGNTDLGK